MPTCPVCGRRVSWKNFDQHLDAHVRDLEEMSLVRVLELGGGVEAYEFGGRWFLTKRLLLKHVARVAPAVAGELRRRFEERRRHAPKAFSARRAA